MTTAPTVSRTPSATQARKTFAPLAAQTARQWRRLLDRQLQPLGLTEATWLPLVHISRAMSRSAGPMRQKDLAISLSLDSSSIVRLLDNLQAAGYIERVEGTDRRAKTLHLMPEGQAIVAQVEKLSTQTRQRMLGGIAEQDLVTAVRVLAQVSTALAGALEQTA